MNDWTTPDSSLGKWDIWYKDLTVDDSHIGTYRYADTVTFKMAENFLSDMEEIEDWGCGTGSFKRYFKGKYVGVDGSKTPWSDKVVDLCDYTSSVPGILMRGVIEHNYEWQKILDNALKSFTNKFCLILFTPFVESTYEIANNRAHGIDVPDIAFSREDIESRLRSAKVHWELAKDIPTDTGYGIEHVYFIER